MKLHLSLISKLCVALGFFSAPAALAATEESTTRLVEVEIVQDNLASYKDRRETHGVYIGVNYEPLDFKNFVSAIDGLTYGDLFGTDGIPLVHFNLDYKYNFILGSVAIGVDYGMGKISDSRSGAYRALDLTKYGVGLKYIADNIMSEPYVAPYVGINAWQMSLTESTDASSHSETTQIGYNYSLGIMLQLDWLDYQSAKRATFDWGIENTYLDLYLTQYTQTAGVEDPDTATDVLYGGGLRMEF